MSENRPESSKEANLMTDQISKENISVLLTESPENLVEHELLDYMFTDFRGKFIDNLRQLIVDQKMNATHFTAFLNFMAGAFVSMVGSPVATRHDFLEGYMSNMHVDHTDDHSNDGNFIVFVAIKGNRVTKKYTLELFYFSDTVVDKKDKIFYLNPKSYENLAREVNQDFPGLVKKNFLGLGSEPDFKVYIATMTGPETIESDTRLLRKATSPKQGLSTDQLMFFKLLPIDINAHDLNMNLKPTPGCESLEEQFLMKMQQVLAQKFWDQFQLDKHDDATYRFFIGTLINWAKTLNLSVDVWMEDYYSTEHSSIRHVTLNFETYPGRVMKKFGIPVVMLIRHPDRSNPDYEGLGAFIRSLGPDAPYQIVTESDTYRFFELKPDFGENPGTILHGFHATFTSQRKFFPGLVGQSFAHQMLNCYPRDQQRVVLMETRKALARGSNINNILAHFLGLLTTESEDGKSFYLALENAYFLSAQKVHLFLIRGWDPSAIIVISEGRVDYVRLIEILIDHCCEFKLPLQFTLTTIDQGTNGRRPTAFRESIGHHFTVSTANQWFDWSSRPEYSEFMNVKNRSRKPVNTESTPIKRRKVAGSCSNLDSLFLDDVTSRKQAVEALKTEHDQLYQGVWNVFDPNVDTDDLNESYYDSQYSFGSDGYQEPRNVQTVTNSSVEPTLVKKKYKSTGDLTQPDVFKSKINKSSDQIDQIGNFDRDKVIKKLLALKNIHYNRQIEIFQTIVKVTKKPSGQLQFWAFDGSLSEKEMNFLFNSVKPHLIRLPDMETLLPGFKPGETVFQDMTKLEHLLFMVGSLAHKFVGLSDGAQIATLIKAVFSHVSDLEAIDDPENDPTVIGIRESNSDDDYVMHKFEFEAKKVFL